MKFYEVSITMTGKSMGRTQENFSTFDRQEKRFKTLDKVKAYLKETYGNCKRVKMYQDTDKGSEAIGWIYCFKNKDYSHDSKPWYQQDWIDVEEMNSTRVLVA